MKVADKEQRHAAKQNRVTGKQKWLDEGHM
jgi:hypothetical protein